MSASPRSNTRNFLTPTEGGNMSNHEWDNAGRYVRNAADQSIVAEVIGPRTADAVDKARLMAAAPRLLEALQQAVQQIPELANVPGIQSAIAKATGQ